jgi:hypothetical protein
LKKSDLSVAFASDNNVWEEIKEAEVDTFARFLSVPYENEL